MSKLIVRETMDVQRMDIQRLPSFEVMIVTATWIVHLNEDMPMMDNVDYS